MFEDSFGLLKTEFGFRVTVRVRIRTRHGGINDLLRPTRPLISDGPVAVPCHSKTPPPHRLQQETRNRQESFAKQQRTPGLVVVAASHSDSGSVAWAEFFRD